ncbi:MAG: GH3 auxin-responsive promoter family protein [Prevotella sp.]|nr:GH3 auxin-responsive promoter family protein [Prevotella sp.]
MSLTSIVSKLFVPRQRELEKHTTQGEQLQQATLQHLVGRGRDTEYGSAHAFGGIRGYEDFARHIPVNSYEEMKGYIDRMRHGESNVLWPGRVKWYAKSSGTTNDKSKFIPVTAEGLKRNHYGGGSDVVTLYLRNNPDSRFFDGRGLILGGSHSPNYNLPNSLVGDLSAILIENINPLVNLIRIPKKETALLSDFELKRDRIAREAIGKNVTNISGVPSWMLSVLTRVMELTGKEHLNDVWPNLEVFFHGGVAFTPYREQYEHLITNPAMHYMETYNASEGFFAVQDDPNDKSMLLLLDRDVFYEFIDITSSDDISKTPVPLWAVETGKNYAMVITTACGLWRYVIGDTVRFTSVNPYKIVITGRTKHFINAFGEELIVDNAEQGLRYACQQTGAEVLEYTAAPVFMDNKARCRHQWIVEFSQEPDDVGRFANLLDKQLQKVNSDYEAKRYKDITLQPLELIKAPKGLFNEWMRLRGKLGGQNKVPRLSNTREYIDQLLALVSKLSLILLLFTSCANMGSPDGGWYDDDPPRVVHSSPVDKATHVKANRIAIYFDEFIKLTDAQSKVIVSPPQLEAPDIREGGKRITVELKDTLKENTTYTIDFGDAIEDNNEGNPMGNYTFSFSTGDHIDTLEVAGYVLDASNLEPIKGILVGLHSDNNDSIMRHKPMVRISRTDSRGHFSIKGVAAGTYCAYALKDADGDFLYGQKSEQMAFSTDSFMPSWKPDTRQDTLWRDSLHIANIITRPYTHFLPDDITLLAFTAPQNDRYLVKTERKQPNRVDVYFSYGSDSLPRLNGLNYDADKGLQAEYTAKRDTVYYWLRDSALINQDTLRTAMTYLTTDTTGLLISKTDTLEFVPKMSYAKRQKELEKEIEKWQKEQEKKKKKGQPYDSIYNRRKTLSLKLNAGNSITPEQVITMSSDTPLMPFDHSKVHIYNKVDSIWNDTPFIIKPREGNNREYDIFADWQLDNEYSLQIDSAAISDIYGTTSTLLKSSLRVGREDEYGTLAVTLSGIRDTGIVVQLLSTSDAVVKQTRIPSDGHTAFFFYLKPGKFYLRAFVDHNGNNIWDTGDYDRQLQAEPVYYYPQAAEVKQKWDIKLSWNVNAYPLYRQKPSELVKQKPEQQKKQKSRNAERAKKLGKEYIKNKTGVTL